jgi:ribosomal-protein-alanine N-acetyltransferase
MLIRAAFPSDVPQIMSLAQQSEMAAHWSAREYDALFAPEAPARVALAAFEESQSGVVAGFVIARCGDDEWEIENVVVDPKSRRMGIGGLLVQGVLQQARDRGASDVFLEVRESNVAARALYQHLGFREQGRRPHYYRDPEEDALVMKLSL